MSLSLTHDVSNSPFAIIVDILSEQLEFVCPVRNHCLMRLDEHVGTQQLLATTYLYRVPAVINKEQSLKTYSNL